MVAIKGRNLLIILGLMLMAIQIIAGHQDEELKVTYKENPSPLSSFEAIQQVSKLLKYQNDDKSRSYKSGNSINYKEYSETLKDFNQNFVMDWFMNYNKENEDNGLQLSPKCNTQLRYLAGNLILAVANFSNIGDILNPLWYSYRVIDSFGKIPTGILGKGSMTSVGDYQECIDINAEYWQGKYCYLSNDWFDPSLDFTDLKFFFGMCLTHACNQTDVEILTKNIYSSFPFSLFGNMNDSNVIITCQEKKTLDSLAISAISVLSIIGFLVVVGTLFDIYHSHFKQTDDNKIHDSFELKLHNKMNGHGPIKNIDGKEMAKKDLPKAITTNQNKKKPIELKDILLPFSAYTNSAKIVDLTPSTNPNQLECLNAIRCLSLAWVILAHVYSFSLSTIENKLEFFKFGNRFTFTFLLNGFLSVDSFFILSGFLVCHLFLAEMKKPNSKISFPFVFKYFFHRYWRLTPVYAILILVSAGLTPYMGHGPFYPEKGYEPTRCASHWWTNLLYINNLKGEYMACFGESWYLANDMQFYCFSFLILVALSRKKKLFQMIGAITCIVVIISSSLTIGLLINSEPGSEAGVFSSSSYFIDIYVKPWTRIIPYMVGILLAYYISLIPNYKEFKLNWKINISLWTVTLIILFFTLYGVDPIFLSENPSTKRITLIVYESLSKLSWSIGLGYIIFACVSGNGGFIGKFFSLSVWKPLARLNYCAYLIHPTVILFFNVNEHKLKYATDLGMAWLFISDIFVTYSAAFVISVCFEAPFIGLEKVLFRSKK